MLEDTWLLLRLKRGNPEALRCLYEKYRVYLLRLAAALMADKHMAEDVVHDVFLRLVQSADRLKLQGSLKSYLRTCVVNGVRNKARAEKIRAAVSLEEADMAGADADGASQWIILKEESQRIHQALAQLPEEQREVIALHLYGEMKFREIAGWQEVSIKTIQSRYRYGLEKLRFLLNGEVEV